MTVPSDETQQRLAALAANARTAAELAALRFSAFPDTNVGQNRLQDLVRHGDRLAAEDDARRARQPQEEDVQPLVQAFAALLRQLARASDLLEVHHVEAAMQQSLEQCRLIRAATARLEAAVATLPHLSETSPDLRAVNELEQAGNLVARDAPAALSEPNISPRVILQWQDIFEALEGVLNHCGEAATEMARVPDRFT